MTMRPKALVAALAILAIGLGGCAATPAARMPDGARGPALSSGTVRVYTGTREILTGPFVLKGDPPQKRLSEFKPVKYPAVFVENEYLRLCLLPTVGGRLYEAYNKASKSQIFFVNPYLETYANDFEGAHPWNLGGVEVNFPYFHHGNTYNDRWQWAEVAGEDGAAGVAMSFTSRPSMQRTEFRVRLRPGTARVDLEYRFENLNAYPWGLAAWIDTMHPKSMDVQFILPTPWVAGHGFNIHRTTLYPWPVRDGIDLSWQKNIPPKGDLSEFAFMPRQHFHGYYDYKRDSGAARVFDPETLPAAKLWTQAPPVTPDQWYQHFEIWTATSAVMEDPVRQAELSAYAAADSWQQVWGIGGYVFANRDLALNLVRQPNGKLLAGVCGTRHVPGCVVTLREGPDTFFREVFDLDPAKPWRKDLPQRAGDLVMEIVAPDSAALARYELRSDPLPQEEWKMPPEPRWAKGLNNAYYEEDYSPLWRRPNQFLDGAIQRYKDLLAKEPQSAALMVDLARACLKDAQVRLGAQYSEPGPKADTDAARRKEADVAQAVELLRKAAELENANGNARLYLGLALESQGKADEALAAYQAAAKAARPAWAAEMYLARCLLKSQPQGALAHARRAAEAYPQSSPARHVLMIALIANAKTVEAVALGKAMLAVDPADPLTTDLLAEACRKAGNSAEAEPWTKETERLLAADPKAAEGLQADLKWLGMW